MKPIVQTSLLYSNYSICSVLGFLSEWISLLFAVMPSSDTSISLFVAWIILAIPGNPCWFDNIEIQPLLVFPAKILPCGVGSSIVPALTDIYPAQPSSQIITVLSAVPLLIVLITLSVVSVRRVILPAASYSVCAFSWCAPGQYDWYDRHCRYHYSHFFVPCLL